MGRWQEIDHTADLALHLWAEDLPDLFRTAARGMAALVADLDTVKPEHALPLTLDALDVEMLLVDWLNELLYLDEMQGLVFTEFDFASLTPTHLQATLYGGPAAQRRGYVKAATFHNLVVRQTAQGYETEIVLDT